MTFDRWRKKCKNQIIYLATVTLITILRNLPEKLAASIMANIGRFAFLAARAERKKTIRHLESVFKSEKNDQEIKQLGRLVFENIGRNACAAIRIPNYFRQGIDKMMEIEGEAHLKAALARGKGVLGITGHIGCWELMAAYLAQKGYPLAVVGKPIYDERLDKILIKHREEASLVNLNRDGAARKMLRWLKAGKMLGVLIDQDTDVESEFVDFMGTPARTPIAPMLLAQRLGAAVVPMAIHLQQNGKHLIRIKPEIVLKPDNGEIAMRRRNLLKCSKAIEIFILENPSQWVWMHERWKTRPVE